MTLTNKQVIDLANQHGLTLQAESLKRNESGLDFQVVLATDNKDKKWVLRLPRRDDVLPTAHKEKRILDFVGPKLIIQTPQWAIFSDQLIAYPLLPGVPTGTIDTEAKAYKWELDEKNVPTVFNETLANALVELHSIRHEEAGKAGLSVKTSEELRGAMRTRMEWVKSTYGVSQELWNRWENWLEADSLWPKQSALIHGDLHAGHILINQQEAYVTGFIDWTEARVDDPANDFTAHLATFGETALKELIHFYEQAGGYVWPAMFEHITELLAAYPIGIAEFAAKSGLKEYEEMAKTTLGV
ncbi:Mph(B) family macrolide 2'-phosphotransferase [Bacillus sp. J14TS2]|uniref:macrolide 2'-phosphotransferase n=1 Tax=Bacillus sp. J14TS2 TaxID=2807188 RepID=UPI001AFED520|nr:macrolide 2'-phosphotransferase [Bacillus sp. J14TS2]GIN72728.1 Mph(B) family macrolide 2'-phosphotransferase [Bacillus sp. J14TS2]